MAIAAGFSKTVTDGLILGYDTADLINSYSGRPTTNLVGTGMSIYNNVGGNVSATLTTNGEFYRGAPVYIQTLTAVNGTGVSQLSNGNNPGIGVVSGGGGGLANRYTGHSIFFKTTVPMHSTPIFLHYSNIGGWQNCCTPPEDMGDGWFRAYVIWYNTVDGNDGKFWAINPLTATLNTPITIYWAGPFKEDLNVQNVSQYTVGTRTSTQGLIDFKRVYDLNLGATSFDNSISPQPTFDGTDDFIDTNFGVNDSLTQVTYEAVIFDTKNNAGYRAIIQNNVASDDALYIQPGNNLGFWPCTTTYLTVPANRFVHVVFSYDGTTMRYSVNGAQHAFAGTCADCLDFDFIRIGAHSAGDGERFAGRIPVAKIYNRALSEKEIEQNFNLYASRFGINPVVKYSEGANAANFVNNWNDATTFAMAQFGGLGPATAHGFTSGPVNFTLTLPGLATHSRIRYRVKWHLVDSLDNETSRMYIGNGSTETEVLTFTKVYNAAPSVSLAGGQLTTSWSGHQTYSHRPWGNGVHGADGYLDIDSGWIDHTSSTLTVRHFMGADQAQADEAMYLTHVEVLTAH